VSRLRALAVMLFAGFLLRSAARAVVDAQTLESFNQLADAAVAERDARTVRAQALMDPLGIKLPDVP
jgi:hypothetical protein